MHQMEYIDEQIMQTKAKQTCPSYLKSGHNNEQYLLWKQTRREQL